VELRQRGAEPLPYALPVLRPLARRLDVLDTLLSAEELQQWTYRGVPLFATSAERITERLIDAARSGITIYPGASQAPREAMDIRASVPA
jgi:hypothetical protein